MQGTRGSDDATARIASSNRSLAKAKAALDELQYAQMRRRSSRGLVVIPDEQLDVGKPVTGTR